MTISNILEHWATIYRPLSHRPEGKMEEQSFFIVRDIDQENIFSRNSNIIHSPCMLHRVVSNGELQANGRNTKVTHHAIFLTKLRDSVQRIGRYDQMKILQASDELMTMCEDLAAYLMQLRHAPRCPVTGRDFKAEDPQLAMQLAAIDADSFDYGVNPLFFGPQWMLADCYWTTTKPLYSFACRQQQKYLLPNNNPEPRTDKA